jgi:hypothetical protein
MILSTLLVVIGSAIGSLLGLLLIISIALSIMERSGIRLPSSPNPLLPSLGEGEQDPIRLPLPDLGEGWGEG